MAKHQYRERIRHAVRNSMCCRPIPSRVPLDVRIHVHRKSNRRSDCDNIAKPILDSLVDALGFDSWGRSDDDRVRRLEVTVNECEQNESVTIEIHALRKPVSVTSGTATTVRGSWLSTDQTDHGREIAPPRGGGRATGAREVSFFSCPEIDPTTYLHLSVRTGSDSYKLRRYIYAPDKDLHEFIMADAPKYADLRRLYDCGVQAVHPEQAQHDVNQTEYWAREIRERNEREPASNE